MTRREETDSTFITHVACPKCGSSDALSLYSDGHGYCFSCQHYEAGTDTPHTRKERTLDTEHHEWVTGTAMDIPKRGLTRETCEKWGYEVNAEKQCHIANYRDSSGALVAQKLRLPGKDFKVVGNGKNMPLYGQWLWGKGKRLIITEGEIDCLSMSQAQNNKWPVVSLPNGAGPQAAKAIQNAYDWLSGFDTIILMFDQDAPGRAAAEEVAALLPLGRVSIATLERKDANEVLLQDGPGALVSAQWNAKPWRPDGIVSGEEFTLERLKTAVSKGFELPWPVLQEKTLGIRKGELTLLTAGSGIGKSTLARELAYWLRTQHGLSIGNVFLEEQNVKTAQAYVALDNNVPLGRLRHNPSLLTDNQWQASIDDIVKGMWFYDHFGSLDSSRLFMKLHYLAKVCKCDFGVLDHISIVTSGMESSSEGERKDIDILMTKLASFTQETGMGIIAIVHLKRAMGKSFNEGSQVSLNDLRGSASLEQLSDNVWALERDQQAEDAEESCSEVIRLLKNRELGDLGEADTLLYDRATGRLVLPVVKDL